MDKLLFVIDCRDGILGHQINKRHESFAPCYSQPLILADLKKTILYFGFNNPCQKNPRNKKTRVYSWITFCRTEENENEKNENQTKTQVWEDSILCPETSNKIAVQEFHLRTGLYLPSLHALTVYSFTFQCSSLRLPCPTMYKLKAGKKLRGLKMADEIIKKQNTCNELAVKVISSHIDPFFGNRLICTRM